MKRIITLTLISFVIVLFTSGITFAEEKKKSNGYIGFGVGTGELKVEGETLDDFFDEAPAIDVGQEVTVILMPLMILSSQVFICPFTGSKLECNTCSSTKLHYLNGRKTCSTVKVSDIFQLSCFYAIVSISFNSWYRINLKNYWRLI